jgi:hypothetical protein
VCKGKIVVTGYNDLATTHPEVAVEWHTSLNGSTTPVSVIAGSHKKYWWICQESHEWQASVKARAGGTGCPSCAGHGFDISRPGILYFLKHVGLGARKIGITNSSSSRLEMFQSKGWTILTSVEHEDGNLVKSIENNLFRWIRNDLGMLPYLGKAEMRDTRGWTETFGEEGPSDFQVIERIELEFEFVATRRSHDS